MADPNELTTEVAPGGDAAAKKDLRRTILRKLPGREVPTFIEQLRGPDGKPRLLIVERLPRAPEVSDLEAGAFVLEARAASALQHPNIVKTRAISTRKDEIVLACDYIEGERLSELMRALAAAGSTLPTDVAVRIFIDILSGLEALHGFSDPKSPDLKLTHGEVGAANVLVGADGVSRLLHTARIRRPGKPSPDAGSTAPEVLAGAPTDRRADLFGIGVLLWQVLSGVAALADAADPDLIAKIRAGRVDRPAPPKDAPWAATLAGVAARAMAIAPGDRYSSAAAMSDELLRIAGSKIAKPAQVAAFVQAKAGEKIAARRKLAERALHPSASETKAPPAVAAAPPASPTAAAAPPASPTAAAAPPATGAAPSKSQEAPATTATATATAAKTTGQPIRSIGTTAKTPPEGAKPPAASLPAPNKFAATIAPQPPPAPAAPKTFAATIAPKPQAAPAAPKPAPQDAKPAAAPPPKPPAAAVAPKPPAATTATKTPPAAPAPQASTATAPKPPAPPTAPKPPAPPTAQLKGFPPPPKAPTATPAQAAPPIAPTTRTQAQPPIAPATPAQAAPPIAPAQAPPPVAPAPPNASAAPAKAPLPPIVNTIVPKTAVASAPKPLAPAAKPAFEPKTPAVAVPNVPKAPLAPRLDGMDRDPSTLPQTPLAIVASKPEVSPIQAVPPPLAKSNVMEIDGTDADSVPPSDPSPDGDRPTFPRLDPGGTPGVTPPVTERPVPVEPKVVIAPGRKDDGEDIDLTDSGPPSSTGAPNPPVARVPETVPVIHNVASAARARLDTPTAAPVTATAQLVETPSRDGDGSDEAATVVVPIANVWRSRLIVAAVAAVCLVIGAFAGFRALRPEEPATSAPTEAKSPPENAAKPAPAAPPAAKIVTPTSPGAATGAAPTAPPAQVEPPAQAQLPPQVQPPPRPDEPAAKDPAMSHPAEQAVDSEPQLFEPPSKTPSGQAPSLPRTPRSSNPEAPTTPPSPRPKFDPKRI